MNFKKILEEINKRQLITFTLLSDFKKKACDSLPTKRRGLYWIWSNLSIEDLQKIKTKTNTKEVPISKLVSQRHNLNNINKVKYNGFTVVYNGIGGYVKETASFGLRERINQEINCNSPKTGTLNLKNRLNKDSNKIYNWAISYFDFDDPNNSDIIKQISENKNVYPEFAKAIEINWRIEFGMPILIRH